MIGSTPHGSLLAKAADSFKCMVDTINSDRPLSDTHSNISRDMLRALFSSIFNHCAAGDEKSWEVMSAWSATQTAFTKASSTVYVDSSAIIRTRLAALQTREDPSASRFEHNPKLSDLCRKQEGRVRRQRRAHPLRQVFGGRQGTAFDRRRPCLSLFDLKSLIDSVYPNWKYGSEGSPRVLR